MKDKEFLGWIAARLVNVYGESPNVDFVQKLRAIAHYMPEEEDTHWPVPPRAVVAPPRTAG